MHQHPGPNDLGLRVIIFCKSVKAVVVLVLSVVLAVGMHAGLVESLQDSIVEVNTHLTHAWSLRLSEWLFLVVTRSHFAVASIALALDGLLTTVEAWGLHRRRRWAEWLVVVASGLLLPVEVFELAQGIRITRVLLLGINLAIVTYLSIRLRRERRDEKETRDFQP